jgi:hypothetical protein
MTTTRSDLLRWLDDALQDTDAVLTPEQRESALDLALMQYSIRRPHWLVTELTGNGSTATWDVPATWVAAWSWLDTVWDVRGTVRPALLDGALFWAEQTPDGWQWRAATAPASGTTLRVRYSAVHTATGQATSVPVVHQQAVGLLGAACALEVLANYAATDSDATLGADTTDFQSRSERYATRARQLRTLVLAWVPAPTPTRVTLARG